eukprot:5147085-Lingulodinium_polyedra.AAC.1
MGQVQADKDEKHEAELANCLEGAHDVVFDAMAPVPELNEVQQKAGLVLQGLDGTEAISSL